MMGRRGEQVSFDQRLALELGARLREVNRICRLTNPSPEQRERAIKLGEQIRMLRRGELPPAGM